MIAGSTVQFPGDAGEHTSPDGRYCPGRAFLAKMVGVGGVYLNTVECTTCHRELTAGENGLAQSRGAGTLSLAEALKSTPLPPVEDVAGLVLEELIKLGKDENVGNFVATFTGNSPLAARTPAMSVVYAAFSWLQARDMIAQGNQAGWYFVTAKGQQIGTAANLKARLATQQSSSAPVPSGQDEQNRDLDPKREQELFNRLSSSSRGALGRAVGLSSSLSQGGVVHMEHLIQGLYDKNPGPTRDLFQQAGYSGPRISDQALS
jgi:hypothetical protein